MYICATGTFVGIDMYGRSTPNKSTLSAAADAHRLEHHFSSAYPEGAWRSLTTSPDLPVTRIDVLDAIFKWIKGVGRGEAGILYFAGHGLVTTHGLVLAAQDFDGRFPSDSGVPVSRVVQLISEIGNADSRYVLVLDCCRELSGKTPIDSVASNISVLYACSFGEDATETDEGGVYAAAMIAWLSSEKAVAIGKGLYCALEGASQKIATHIRSRTGYAVQVPTQFGADPAEILLPSRPQLAKATIYDKGNLPRVCLRSAPLALEDIAHIRSEVNFRAFEFCAISVGNFGSAFDLCEVTTDQRVCVWFDFVESAPDLCAFFDFMTWKLGAVFHELELYWNSRLDSASIVALAASLHMNQVNENGVISSLFWEAADRTHCKIGFDDWMEFGTRAVVACRRVGASGRSYPLVQLMPQLSFVLRRLVRLDAAEPEERRVRSTRMQTVEGHELNGQFYEYCRFAEAALASNMSPDLTGFRGPDGGGLGAAFAYAVLEEFWLLLCTNDKRYAKVRTAAKGTGKSALLAISAYVTGKWNVAAGTAAGAVSVVSVIVARVGHAALCRVMSERRPERDLAKL